MLDDIIYLEKITVDFDGFKALNNVNFFVNEGDLHFLIGPNGAGKTTLLDVICGKTQPTEGRLFFKQDQNLLNLKPHQISTLGISRKFQAPSIFSDLTVYENLELAGNPAKGFFSSLTTKISGAEKDRIQEVLEKVRLPEERHIRAGDLAHGKKQWLELGMTIVQKPELLLVDEPVAGMTGQERDLTGRILADIAETSTVVVVEHDMKFVKEFSHHVTVLHDGSVLCQGTFDQVSKDPTVIDVYLGRGNEEVLHA